jgi:hypothetical protein
MACASPRETGGEKQARNGAASRSISPPDLDTHSAHQTFYVDSSGLIRRHDYTAEVVGGWARAAHHLSEHRQVDGLAFPTRRRVRPIGVRNRALPGPTLVWIELDALGVQKG